ncbi:hypothetical protein MnTg02_02110 [bacterium MnTg02]|nr:hypothetical protein MnTg02_02110 [bacterium MnTg02]
MKHVCIFLSLFVLLIGEAQAAGKRVALLIGNKDYALDKLDLKNPHNDIAHVAAALEKVGFEVALVKDAGLGKLQRELRRYTAKLRRAGSGAIGFFYYSGHGAVNDDTRTNYLIPVDVKNIDSEELWYSSVRLRSVIDELKSQAGNAQHFVVFDACRNSLQLASNTSKSLLQSKGFKAEREVRGMLISYATAEGKIASDVGDNVGPYASALAAEIIKPGVEAVAMFRNVQLAVQDAINQEPWLTYGALRETYFAGAKRVQTAKPAAASKPSLSEAARVWAEVKDSENESVLEAFIKQYSGTVQAQLARPRLTKLKAAQVAALPKPTKPAKPSSEVMPAVGVFPKNFKPGHTFKDCDVCPEMVVVPARSFMMGSPKGEMGRDDDEEPQHKVTISKPLAAGKFEITRGQFEAFVKAARHAVADICWTYEGEWKAHKGRSYRNPGFSQTDDHPAVCVNWDDANAYVK